MKSSSRRLLATCSVFALMSVGVSTHASAQDPDWERTVMVPTGDMSLTGISGLSGSLNLMNLPQSAFLRGFTAWERNDAPCQMRATYWYEHASQPRNPERTVSSDVATLNRCGATPSSGSARSVMVTGWRQADGSAQGVAGVQVCLNKKRTRVKGIKVLGARISPTGEVTHSSAYDRKFERSNCHQWEPAKRCAGDRVATGAHLHYSGSSLRGIELECQAVEIRALATRD